MIEVGDNYWSKYLQYDYRDVMLINSYHANVPFL